MVATERLLGRVSLEGFPASQARSTPCGDGPPVNNEEYHPYGTTSWWASNGSTDVSQKRYRYTGKEKDEETGLAYHGARYLITWLGRWERVDPKPDPKWSRYEYCRCSPTNHVDADGAEPQDVVGAAIWEAATWYPKTVMAAHAGLKAGAQAFAADPVGTLKAGLQKDVAVAKAGIAVASAVYNEPGRAAAGVAGALLEHGTVGGLQHQMRGAIAADDTAAGGAAGRDLGAMLTLGMAGEALAPVVGPAVGQAVAKVLPDRIPVNPMFPLLLGLETGGPDAASVGLNVGYAVEAGASPAARAGASAGAAEHQQLLGVLGARLKQLSGFGDVGVPVILDENLQASAAQTLRDRGFNVRSVGEVFGTTGVPDEEIIDVAERLGARVLTKNVRDFPPEMRVGVPPRASETNVNLFEQLLDHEGLRATHP